MTIVSDTTSVQPRVARSVALACKTIAGNQIGGYALPFPRAAVNFYTATR